MSYDEAKTDIQHSLELGVQVEQDDPHLRRLVTSITDEQIEWISAWLAGEGFGK